MDVGEAEVAALESERQPLVVEPQQVQYRGVQIVHVAVAVDRTKAKLIRGADDVPGLDTAPGHPHGEGVDVMVAALRLPRFTHRSSAKFPAPDDQRVVEHAMRLEVADQRGARLVDVVRHLVKIFRERLARAAVAVPVGVVKLDEPRAALHQPPG